MPADEEWNVVRKGYVTQGPPCILNALDENSTNLLATVLMDSERHAKKGLTT